MLEKLIKDRKERQERDKARYDDLDEQLCMICHAYGNDKRSLFVSCFYAVHETVPEAIDLSLTDQKDKGYYLRICKMCRAEFLTMMGKWRTNRTAMRNIPKDHDGGIDYAVTDKTVPVRLNGMTIMLSPDEFKRFKEKK